MSGSLRKVIGRFFIRGNNEQFRVKYDNNCSNLINLVGISDGIVTIGFPGFDFTPEVQCRQIINYYVWRGKIPRPIYWVCISLSVH